MGLFVSSVASFFSFMSVCLQRLHEAQEKFINAVEEQGAYGPLIPAAKRLCSAPGEVTGPYPDTAHQYEMISSEQREADLQAASESVSW